MNKVYKVLFNKSIGKYVVVSENSKSAKKSSKTVQSIVLAAVAFSGTSITMAAALALGGGTATGTDTIAIGESANATKANGIAIGSTALASEINAIAMGFKSNSSGENSTAIGNSSVASKQGSIALGQNTESSGADSVAIGSVAKATADNTVALGARSNALSINSIAVGTGTTSSGEDTISVGTNAAASDKNTIALGVNSKSSAENATAFGLNAAAAGADSLAFGTNAAASVKNTIALGLNSKSSAENATALGLGANASAKDTISIGTNAKTSDVNAIALGINSKSLSGNAVAIGLRSEAAGADSLAFGSAARTSDVNSIALGNQAAASKANTIALGTQTKAAGANAIALGNQADASVFQSIALGTSAKASAADTVALGTGSIASGNSAIALGNKAQALGSNSISIGKGNIVSGKNSAAIGDPSNISGNNSYSLGNNNTIATDNTFVVGSGVTVNTAANTVNGNVILGNLSADKAYVQVSNGTINGKTYNYAGTAAGVVSVGAIGAERQIVNVAPGAITATSTDAINGSQLYATNAVVGQVADDAAKALGTTINPATGGINAPTYITNNPVTGAPTTSNNVGDAIKNLNAAVNSPLTFTDAATGSSTNPLGSRFKIEGDQNITTVVSQGQAKIQLNPDLKGINSITLGNTVLNPNGLTVGGPTGPSITTNGINAGDKAITNVAPGVNGTDAVNVDQLKAQETTLGNKGLNFSANSGAAVHKNLGDTLGVIGTGTKADSEYSGENVKTITDANGNIVVQLDKNLTADSLTINGKPGVNGQPGTPGLSITGAQGPAGVNGQPGEVTTRIEYNDGTGPQQVANLNDGLKFAGNQGSTINKKLNETLSIKGDLANADAATATNLRVDEENGELKIKLARNLTDLDSVTVGNTVLNPNGLTVGGPTGPSITTNGINAGDKAITNVAPGVNGTDAVNVDQLKAQETTLGNKGLNFSANSGPAVHKNLGDTLGVIGTGTKSDSEYSGENVKTITDANGNIVVQLDKNLTADSLTINGKPGVNGQPGTPGLSITGAQGPAGVNGQPGEVTTRIEYNDGTGPQQVANLNDGLKFTGNQGSTINKKLNETLSIKGDLANADAATATNLRVDEENGELKIKLARNLTDLDSVTVGDTVLNPNGLTVGGPTGPSITTNGINAGDKAITNVAPGVNGTDAVNVDQLKAQETTLGNKGLNFSANSGPAVHKNLGDTLGVIGTGTKSDSEYSGENVKTITDANGNIVVQLDKNLTADSLIINGKPGVNGQPGTPGLSITGAQGPAGVNGQPGEVTTRIEYNDGTGPQQVANLNDGLKFTGNQGSTINKKLNETLSIKGDLANADAATATNLRVDEENGELKIKLARNLTDLDSVTVGDTVLNPNGLTVGGPTGPSITTNGINAGDKAITNVAPGVNGTDAVNLDQLTKQTAVATTEVKAADGDKNVSVEKVTAKDGHSIYNVGVSRDLNVDTVTLPNVDGSSTKLSANGLSFVDIAGNPTGPMVTANGIDAGNQKITNVAPAIISKESKDAVNGSQLYNLGNNINNVFGGNASYDGDIINWTNIGGTGHNNIDDAIKSIGDQATNANKGWNIATDNGVTSNVKPNDTVNINGDKTSGIIISNVGNNITVGLADKVNIGDKIKIDGTTGEINAGQIKIDGNKGTVNNLTNTTWNGPDQIISGQAATEDQLAQAVKNVTNQTTAAKTEVTQGENIVVTSSKASDGHTIYNVETAKDVKFNSVKSDVVQVGNVQIDKDGINAGNQKVTNVEAGTISKESKDAVNGSQLYQSNQNIANYLGGGSNIDANGNTTAPTYNVNGGSYNNVGDALGAIDNRVTNVQNNLEQAFNYTNKRIEDVENNANAGTAQALATAGLPQAYIPGKSMMAISGGTFRGESGYAIGFSSISDNGRWVIKVTGSGNSRDDFGGTIGGGIQW